VKSMGARFCLSNAVRLAGDLKIPTNIPRKARDAAHKKGRNLANHQGKSLKCPINDLPNEILASIFSIGVNEEDDGDEEEDNEWEDMDTGERFDADETG
jgi:hypothetical protein